MKGIENSLGYLSEVTPQLLVEFSTFFIG